MVRSKDFDARQRIKELSMINALNEALNAAAATLQQAAHAEADVFGAVQAQLSVLKLFGSLSLFDTDNRLVLRSIAYPRKALKLLEKLTGLSAIGYSIPWQEVEIYRHAIETKRPIFIEESSEAVRQFLPPKAHRFLPQIFETLHNPPGILAPLVSEGRVLGVFTAAGADLSQESLPAMTAFANHIAIVLEKASLFEDLARESRQRIQAQEELNRYQRGLLSTALQAAKAGAWEWVIATGKATWSEENFRLMGYDPGKDQSSYENWLRVVHPEDRQAAEAQVNEAVKGDGNLDIEFRIVLPDGKIRWIRDVGSFILDEHGEPYGLYGIQLDITERKVREEERARLEFKLRESEARYRTLFDRVPVGLYRTTPSGAFIDVNQALVEILGYPDHQTLLEQKAIDLHVRPEARSAWQDRLLEQGVDRSEVQARRWDGETIWLESHARVIYDQHGVPSYYDGSLLDINERKIAEAAQRRSAQLLDRTFASLSDAVFVIDVSDRTIVACNPAVASVFGYSVEEVIGRNTEFLHVDHEKYLQFAVQLYPVLDAKGIYHSEYQMRRKDGSIFTSEYTVTEILDAEGRRSGAVSVVRDITERKRWEQRLRLLESVVVYANDAIVVTEAESIDLPGPRIVYVNEAFTRMTGHRLEEVLGKSPRILQGSGTTRATLDRIRAALEKKESVRAELINHTKDGSQFWVDVNIVPIYDEDGHHTHWLSVQREITDRKRAEGEREELFQQVQAGRERLKVLSKELVEVQENERRHLAHELHDETGQALTGLKLILEIAEKMSSENGELKKRILQAQEIVDQITTQVHDLSLDLRPPMLDDMGLLPTFLWHFERYGEQTDIRVDLSHRGLKNRRFPQRIEIDAFRIVQEALTNVARHAHVDRVMVRLWADDHILGLQVEDRGSGFDTGSVSKASGIGLASMRERSELLGGLFEIVSSPKNGTRLIVELPIDGGAIERRER